MTYIDAVAELVPWDVVNENSYVPGGYAVESVVENVYCPVAVSNDPSVHISGRGPVFEVHYRVTYGAQFIGLMTKSAVKAI